MFPPDKLRLLYKNSTAITKSQFRQGNDAECDFHLSALQRQWQFMKSPVNTHYYFSVCLVGHWVRHSAPRPWNSTAAIKLQQDRWGETLTASILIHFQLLVCLHGFAPVSDRRSISRRRGEEGEGGRSILIMKQVSWMNILCGMAAAAHVLGANWWTNSHRFSSSWLLLKSELIYFGNIRSRREILRFFSCFLSDE